MGEGGGGGGRGSDMNVMCSQLAVCCVWVSLNVVVVVFVVVI